VPSAMSVIELTVNGKPVSREVAPRTHLGDFLRDELHLTGTHLGCEHGVCGACTVLVDDVPVRACISFAVGCAQQHVRTIEGFDDDELMGRLREAFSRHHALQCGFCTPGMLLTARDIVQRLPQANEARIRLELAGNLCRCTGYMGIVSAIQAVLRDLKTMPLADGKVLHDAPFAIHAAPPHAQTARSPTSDPAPLDSDQEIENGSEPAATVAQNAGPSGKTQAGWSRVEDSFVVPFPIDQVWKFMSDVSSVAACLPGAELLGSEGDRMRGRIVARFGPMSASFMGAAHLERSPQERRLILRGAGQDALSRSRANGSITCTLSDDSASGQTWITVRFEYILQGPLAQFSRSGLVTNFMRRMVANFGVRVTAQLGSIEIHETPKPDMRKFVLRDLWHRLKRVFRAGR
jgi:aerobic carbon-monoxide dehydrogenase small subunit